VYDTLGSLGIGGTQEPARISYLQALRLNPRSPRVLLVLARLEYIGGDKVKSKDYLEQALTLRPNYLEAVSFLVQLDIQNKNVDGAIAAIHAAVGEEPTNFLLRFALGYLEFTKGDFTSAAGEFEMAVRLNPSMQMQNISWVSVMKSLVGTQNHCNSSRTCKPSILTIKISQHYPQPENKA